METEQDCVIVVPNIKLELLGNSSVVWEHFITTLRQAMQTPQSKVVLQEGFQNQFYLHLLQNKSQTWTLLMSTILST